MTVLITGEVQGVGYRAFVQRHAKDRDISGYAENLDDGRVEVVAEGYQDDLEQLLHQLKRGPAHAEVTATDVSWTDASGLDTFHVY
ncbi:MAG: acylphosphatase [Deinococcota bacterium]